MIALSVPSPRFLQIILFITCFSLTNLYSQTIDKRYLGRWLNYTQGSAAKPDSNYTIVDTIIEMTFRLDGTYNISGYIKTDIFTPGKGHLRFKKNFRFTEGRYEISNNNLELSTIKLSDPSLCRSYAFESTTDKFKHVNRYYRLWDSCNFYAYEPVSDFKQSTIFYSRKRQHQKLYTVSPSGIIMDSIAFWNTNPSCNNESQWPKPVLLKKDIPLKTDTIGGFDDLVDDLDNVYQFDITNRLSRYYYTSKKVGAFYYDISYTDSLNIDDLTIKTITDSKDGAHYVFIRDEKNCLLKINRYDSENRLVETYFAK